MSGWTIYDEALKEDLATWQSFLLKKVMREWGSMPAVAPRMPSNWWSLFETSEQNVMNLPKPPEATPRANPKNPKDNIWDHMDKETDEFLQTAGPEHFGPRPKTIGWHVAPRTEQRKGKTMNEKLLKIFLFVDRGSWLALYEGDRITIWQTARESDLDKIVDKAKNPAIKPHSPVTQDVQRLLRECKRGEHDDCCVWSRGAKPPGLKSGVAMELEAERAAPIKEFPFAEHQLADSFEEFDYSVNAPSEGGLSIDVMDRDDDAAERILRARIARQQKWPFCPTHQRNVDLEFNHDGVGHDKVIHEAYWICLDCRRDRCGD
jgi:hypothetical protein